MSPISDNGKTTSAMLLAEQIQAAGGTAETLRVAAAATVAAAE